MGGVELLRSSGASLIDEFLEAVAIPKGLWRLHIQGELKTSTPSNVPSTPDPNQYITPSSSRVLNGNKPVDVFISYRISESTNETRILQKELEGQGLSVFVSEALIPGSNMQKNIADSLMMCKLVVLMASATYGRDTGGLYSTCQELNFVMTNRKPFYLIKMCDVWEESHVQLILGGAYLYQFWTPNTKLPHGIVEEITTHRVFTGDDTETARRVT